MIGLLVAGPLGAIAGLALHRVIPSAVLAVFAHKRHWIDISRELRVVPAVIAGALVAKVTIALMAAIGVSNIVQLLRH
jgi:hypothetical protein